MALKFLGSGGSGYTSGAVECLDYAVMMKTTYGVDIRLTSNTWGGGGYSQALHDAINASKDAGMLFIAAAGNSSSDNDSSPHYPSSYDVDNVVAVASTDRNDAMSSFSCYGATSVDLGAPGSSILSSTPGNTYSTYSVTSMATPHVAGSAALVWAQFPDHTWSSVKNLILNTVDPLSSLAGKTVTGGRLNVSNALSCVPGNPNMSIISPSSGFSASLSQGATVSVRLTDCASPVTGATVLVSPTRGGSAFNLLDNGVSPDQSANDGTYSGIRTPSVNGSVTLNIEVSGVGDSITGSVSGTIIQNYGYIDEISYNWIDATAGTRISPFYDDDLESVPIGFDFVFYGNTYDKVIITSNGYITFDTSNTSWSYWTNYAIPSSSVPNDFIAPFWDDLNPYTGGSVYYLLGGTAPSRRFTVEWYNVPHYYNTGAVSFEVTLYEGSNNIVFRYKDVDFGYSYYNKGASATVGVENESGNVGVQCSYNQSNLSDGSAILFSINSTPGLATVITGSATTVTTRSAAFNGTVNPNGSATTVEFEYGEDTNYGQSLTAIESPLTGDITRAVTGGISGLKTAMTYHFRVKANNQAGTTYGEDQSFTAYSPGTIYIEQGGYAEAEVHVTRQYRRESMAQPLETR